jgi:hypothetical protein
MGDPVKLTCSICGDEYYLCTTCATFKDGMRAWQAERKKAVVGILICGLSAFCVGMLVLWFMFWRG